MRRALGYFLRAQKSWIQPLILVAVTLIVLHIDVVFGGRTLLPIDEWGLLDGMPYGYSGPRPATATTCDPGASYAVDYGFDATTVQFLRDGHFPFWNPHQGLGQPLFANGLSAVAYPVNWLIVALPRAYWDIIYLLNWLLAAWFAYLYVRIIGRPMATAILAAMCVLSSGYFQIWLAVREVPSVAAWWPLLLYGIERNLQPGTRIARHLPLAVATYATITGGQPEVTALSALAAAAYLLFRLAARPHGFWRRLAGVLPGILAGVLIAAPMWVNFLDYALGHAFSAHGPESVIGRDCLPVQTLATFVFPFLYGPMFQAPLAGPGFRFDNPGWCGGITVFLALAAALGIRRRFDARVLFLALLSVLSLAKVWGLPLLNELGRLPILSRVVFFRYVGFLPAFGLSILAVDGLAEISQMSDAAKRVLLGLWSAVTVVVLVLTLWSVWPRAVAEGLRSEASVNFLTAAVVGLLWAVGAPAALCWMSGRHPGPGTFATATCGVLLQGVAYQPSGDEPRTMLLRQVICVGLFLLIVLTVGFFGLPSRRHASLTALLVLIVLPQALFLGRTSGRPRRCDPLKEPPYISHLRALQQGNLYRSYSYFIEAVPHPNFTGPLGISSLNSADALVPLTTSDFIYQYLDMYASPWWFSGSSQNVPSIAEYWRNKRYFDLVGVRYLVLRGDSDPTGARYGGGGGWSPHELDRPVTVRLRVPVDDLASLQIPFATYSRRNEGELLLKVTEDAGATLAQARLPTAELSDRSDTTVSFGPLRGMRNHEIKIQLEFKPSAPGAMIGVFRAGDFPEWGFIFRIPASSPPPDPVYLDPQTSIRIVESPQALPRVFLAPSASIAENRQDALGRLAQEAALERHVWIEDGSPIESSIGQRDPAGRLLSFRLEPNDVWIAYHADAPGILTLTDAWLPGWQATVDSRSAPVLRVDGVFRGVRMQAPGNHSVHFQYRPPHLILSMLLLGSGIALLGLILCYGRRGGEKREEQSTTGGGSLEIGPGRVCPPVQQVSPASISSFTSRRGFPEGVRRAGASLHPGTLWWGRESDHGS